MAKATNDAKVFFTPCQYHNSRDCLFWDADGYPCCGIKCQEELDETIAALRFLAKFVGLPSKSDFPPKDYQSRIVDGIRRLIRMSIEARRPPRRIMG